MNNITAFSNRVHNIFVKEEKEHLIDCIILDAKEELKTAVRNENRIRLVKLRELLLNFRRVIDQISKESVKVLETFL